MRVSHSASCVGLEEHAALLPAFEKNFVGPELAAEHVEDRLADLYGCAFAKLTSSGSNALLLALGILQRQYPGRNQVLVSGYVCPAVVNVIMALRLVPVFVDVNSDDLNIDAADARSRITASTLAVVLTNLGGFPDRLQGGLGVPVILDACQSIGSRLDGDLVPGDPAFVIFSFGPTKPLTGGIGGALLTNDPEINAMVRFMARGEHDPELYRKQGYRPTFAYDLSALNILLIDAQLDRLDSFLGRRNHIAGIYTSVLNGLNFPAAPDAPDAEPNYYRYYLLTPYAERMVAGLQDLGVDARTSLAHNFGAYGLENAADLPRLHETSGRVVSLPIYPALDEGEVQFVGDQVQRVIEEGLG